METEEMTNSDVNILELISPVSITGLNIIESSVSEGTYHEIHKNLTIVPKQVVLLNC